MPLLFILFLEDPEQRGASIPRQPVSAQNLVDAAVGAIAVASDSPVYVQSVVRTPVQMVMNNMGMTRQRQPPHLPNRSFASLVM